MDSTTRHCWPPLGYAILVGCISLLPYLLHPLHPLWNGLIVIRDKDYGNYYSRLERALNGHFVEADNAITPVNSGIEGVQSAGMEQIVGFLLGWTGLSAPVIAIALMPFLAAGLFLLLHRMFLRMEFPQNYSLAMTLVLFVVLFHGFTRHVQPGWSWLIAVSALIASWDCLRKPSIPKAVLSGLLLGGLPYLYFWHWMFVWASVAVFSLLLMVERKRMHLHVVGLIAGVTLLVSVPFLVNTNALMQNPLYPEIAIRASFLYQRTPESWPRAILLFTQIVLLASFSKNWKQDWGYRSALALLIGIFFAMHQNVINNKVLMFASHFYPHLLVATTVAAGWVLLHKPDRVRTIGIVGIAAVFLLAGAWDYSPGHRFFIPTAPNFEGQHLAKPIRLLDNDEREVVLTDAYSGRMLTAWTDDGIIYTTHARFLIISDAEIAERYCVTELFTPDPPRDRVIDLEYNRILQSPEREAYEDKLVADACARVKADPEGFLKNYGVTHVLWNSITKPDWVVDTKRFHLTELSSGSGWTLWKR